MQWLIYKNKLREKQELGNNRHFAIGNTITNVFNIAYLCVKGLRFERILKIVDKYLEARLELICFIYYSIGHYCQGSCGPRPVKCILYARSYKLKK